MLPESPPYFDKDQLTDKPARFFVSEITREKILLYYDKEIPYSVEVKVERFKETEKKIHINTVIYVERESQKDIYLKTAYHKLLMREDFYPLVTIRNGNTFDKIARLFTKD